MKARVFPGKLCKRTVPSWLLIGLGYILFMTEVEKQILAALLDLEHAVARMAAANPKPNLLPLFARIDTLTLQLPPETDPSLLHYLRKRSYEKARLFLQERGAEISRGNCARD